MSAVSLFKTQWTQLRIYCMHNLHLWLFFGFYFSPQTCAAPAWLDLQMTAVGQEPNRVWKQPWWNFRSCNILAFFARILNHQNHTKPMVHLHDGCDPAYVRGGFKMFCLSQIRYNNLRETHSAKKKKKNLLLCDINGKMWLALSHFYWHVADNLLSLQGRLGKASACGEEQIRNGGIDTPDKCGTECLHAAFHKIKC